MENGEKTLEFVKNYGRNFMRWIDDFISNHFQELRCSDVYDLYFNFTNELKNWKGTSSGFTGLSELIIFRMILNLFGKKFELIKRTPDTRAFRKGDIILASDVNALIDKREQKGRLKPDISIYKGNKLLVNMSIKIYVDSTEKIDSEIEKFKELRSTYPNMECLIIIYHLSRDERKSFNDLKNLTCFKYLMEKKKEFNWINYLILQKNHRNFLEEIEKRLKLSKIACE